MQSRWVSNSKGRPARSASLIHWRTTGIPSSTVIGITCPMALTRRAFSSFAKSSKGGISFNDAGNTLTMHWSPYSRYRGLSFRKCSIS